jgi:hypothetical protein
MNIASYAKRLLNYAEMDETIDWEKLGSPGTHFDGFAGWLRALHRQLASVFGRAADDALRLASCDSFQQTSFDYILAGFDDIDDDQALNLVRVYADNVGRQRYFLESVVASIETMAKSVLSMTTIDFLAIVEALRNNGFNDFADFLVRRRGDDAVTQIQKSDVERRPSMQDVKLDDELRPRPHGQTYRTSRGSSMAFDA